MFSYIIILIFFFSFLLQKISSLDRANLLDDLFSLADAGELDYNIVMDISTYLTKEYHALPWAVAKSKFMTMNTLLTSSIGPHTAEKFQVIYQLEHYKLLSDTVAKGIFTRI